MHPAQIKAALGMRDTTQAAIAVQCGVTPTAVNDVVHGRKRSRQIELRIAAITQTPLAELWPQWHGPKAKRARRRARSFTTEALRAALG